MNNQLVNRLANYVDHLETATNKEAKIAALINLIEAAYREGIHEGLDARDLWKSIEVNPLHNGVYLCVIETLLCKFKMTIEYYEGMWRTAWAEHMDNRITHWLELPEYPNE